MKKGNAIVERLELAIPEQRLDLDLSLRELARLSGVSRSTDRSRAPVAAAFGEAA